MFPGNLGCRHCQYYQQQGRRGGHCQKLGVAVRGTWPACSLIVLPFAAAWEKLPDRREQPQLLESESLAPVMPPPGS